MSRIVKGVTAACYVALATAGLLAARRAEVARQDLVRPLETLLGSSELPARLGLRAQVIVVFRPFDCSNSLDALRRWNDLHHRRPALVRGVLALTPAQRSDTTLLATLQGIGVEYPVDTIDALPLMVRLRALGHAATPLAVVVDSARRVVATVDAAEVDAPRMVEVIAVAARRGTPQNQLFVSKGR